ncbi:sodium/potassium-transporting ATPase subunit beta-3 isoform X2 [Sarcophilus harrisii]|uniref:sodium/potassium-transporting ATPase subunit beta-3 isoform X2 n=1 Tax=Sarcophilus harrisii TaxID=9305 RepID=UPI001301AD3F|nr:sodium/potassium-transporting ATPase subunit beta-3 isoform X2 [Sarcophilus harrisii]
MVPRSVCLTLAGWVRPAAAPKGTSPERSLGSSFAELLLLPGPSEAVGADGSPFPRNRLLWRLRESVALGDRFSDIWDTVSLTSRRLILLFYLAFYGFLAALFTFTMWVMLQTLSDETPKYRDQISSPGLTIVPKPPGALEFSLNISKPATYENYIDAIKEFLREYEGKKQEHLLQCRNGTFFEQDNIFPKKTCKFSLETLGPCSGLNDVNFGYPDGNPCIFVKMNRIIGLRPQGEPRIVCAVKEGTEVNLATFPKDGRLDLMYFPYYGKKLHNSQCLKSGSFLQESATTIKEPGELSTARSCSPGPVSELQPRSVNRM